MKDLFKDMPVISSILIIFLLGIPFLLIDVFASKTEPFNGIVIDKHYKAEINSTGTGSGMIGNGKSAMMMTHQHESEQFLLMVKTNDNKVVTVECKPELYYEKIIGQKIDCNINKGFFTGLNWSVEGVK